MIQVYPGHKTHLITEDVKSVVRLRPTFGRYSVLFIVPQQILRFFSEILFPSYVKNAIITRSGFYNLFQARHVSKR